MPQPVTWPSEIARTFAAERMVQADRASIAAQHHQSVEEQRLRSKRQRQVEEPSGKDKRLANSTERPGREQRRSRSHRPDIKAFEDGMLGRAAPDPGRHLDISI
ncbi:MAG: hypothetical protein ACLFU6_05905 [Candidatus Hydrogenedentota bacterium]